MDSFFPVQKAVKTATVQDMIAVIKNFRYADIFSAKCREAAYN